MMRKVIAIGNTLMKDDSIGIEVAKEIEEKLLKKHIQVIYGETDIEYALSNVQEEDYIYILDAAFYGKNLGDITWMPFRNFISNNKGYSNHSYSFLDLLRIYYPNIQGEIYGIEVANVEFGLGLSIELKNILPDISKKIFKQIENGIEN